MMYDFRIEEFGTDDTGWYISDGHNNYLWKDLTAQKDTGFFQSNRKYGEAPGYYHSVEEAKQYLDVYFYIENLKRSVLIRDAYIACCGWYILIDGKLLWKDGELHIGSTGYNDLHSYGEAPGYYCSLTDAVVHVDAYVESEKQKQLTKIEETEMANNYVVIEGKTINLSDETVRNLKKELGIKDLEHGDIVTCSGDRQYLAWQHPTDKDKLNIHGLGYINGTVYKNSTYYKSIGKNIFKDNLLNLTQ